LRVWWLFYLPTVKLKLEAERDFIKSCLHFLNRRFGKLYITLSGECEQPIKLVFHAFGDLTECVAPTTKMRFSAANPAQLCIPYR